MPKTNKTAEAIEKGSKFTSWMVTGLSDKIDYLDCVCDCGTERSVNVYSLKSGKSKSCGCKSATLLQQTIERRKCQR